MAYEYVRHAYFVDPLPGERIRCHSSGVLATIVRPRLEDQYVHARIDGEKRISRFHPTAIDYLGAQAKPDEKEGGCATKKDHWGAERTCQQPHHWDDGVPYCDTCGLYRHTIHCAGRAALAAKETQT